MKMFFHTQASGAQLPYPDNSFGLVVSNHAIDFMPDEAFDEAGRVLHPQGKAIFYFHHSAMIPDNLKRLKRDRAMYWKYLKDNKILFSCQEEIIEKMTRKGFATEECNLTTDGVDKWWEVVLRKGGEDHES